MNNKSRKKVVGGCVKFRQNCCIFSILVEKVLKISKKKYKGFVCFFFFLNIQWDYFAEWTVIDHKPA